MSLDSFSGSSASKYSSRYSSRNSSINSHNIDDHSIEFNPVGCILNNKYLLISELGYGGFATVWLAYNINSKKYFAIKIQDSGEIKTGEEEVKLFNKFTNEQCPYINKIIETFYHKMEYGIHICMVFELMAGSLFDIMEMGRYSKGIPHDIAKIITYQLLIAITVLNKKYNLVHTDLKTENILIKGINKKTQEIINIFNKDKRLSYLLSKYHRSKGEFDDEIKEILNNMNLNYFEEIDNKYQNQNNIEIIDELDISKIEIKLSDFGNCRYINDLSFHIQTRYYRSPEVILEYQLNENCDMWSVACLIFEILTAQPLIEPKKNQKHSVDQDHLYRIISLLGKIPDNLVNKSNRKSVFFKNNGLLKGIYNINYCPLNKYLFQKLHFVQENDLTLLVDLMQKLLKYDPFERIDSYKAIQHQWFYNINKKNN